MALKKLIFPLMLIGVAVLGSACAQEPEIVLSVPSLTPGQQDIIQSATPPSPPKVLSVCLGEEPTSLFLYGDRSLSANIIRQAIYDGPVDEVNHRYQPVLLERLPSQENGLVKLQSISLQFGDRMVDLDGNLTVLNTGVRYLPSGCFSPSCAEEYQNEEDIVLDQVVITFPLKKEITWSDGIPLTAHDSVYAYQIAQVLFQNRPPKKQRLTDQYIALDDQTIQWTGVPGFLGIHHYTEYFFSPFPEHRWGDLEPVTLLTVPEATQTPLGWGAYQVEEWILGDHISLTKNPNYAGDDQGLGFDGLVYRFVRNVDEGLAALRAGECEILLNTPGLEERVQEMGSETLPEDIEQVHYTNYVWDQISFGVQSLDPDRTILENKNVRKAISQCIYREALVDQSAQAEDVVDSFYPPDDPRYASPPELLTYSPDEAAQLLEEEGWVDHDQNPDTPRIARDVRGVRDDSELSLTLVLDGTEQLPEAGVLIQESLAGCGVDLQVIPLEAESLLAPGPEGPIFGRKFDLAKFAWTTADYHPCRLFMTSEIPGDYPEYPKGWGGANASGYSNPAFDEACQEILHNLPDQSGVENAYQMVQRLLREEYPVLPLYFRYQVMLYHSTLTGIDAGGAVPLWNIEAIRD